MTNNLTANKQVADKQDIIDYAIRLADDSLVLGHRVSEWTTNAPFLEEDIAMGNVALDYVGRARMLYTYAAELEGNGTTEDDYAYLRNERQFQNYLILELPKGDFAFTIVRQLLVDVYYQHYLSQLINSTDETIAAVAAKSIKETKYHLRRSKTWSLRLGDGTDESHQRMQNALSEIWGYIDEMFETDALEQRLIDARVAVDPSTFKAKWLEDVSAVINEATLDVPESTWAVRGGREGYHTEHFGLMLAVMQSVHRAHPGASW